MAPKSHLQPSNGWVWKQLLLTAALYPLTQAGNCLVCCWVDGCACSENVQIYFLASIPPKIKCNHYSYSIDLVLGITVI